MTQGTKLDRRNRSGETVERVDAMFSVLSPFPAGSLPPFSPQACTSELANIGLRRPIAEWETLWRGKEIEIPLEASWSTSLRDTIYKFSAHLHQQGTGLD